MIHTQRLILRPWRQSDLEPFARLNANQEAMEYFPACLSRTESDQLVQRITDTLTTRGWGLYAVELMSTGTFVGFTGLSVPAFAALALPKLVSFTTARNLRSRRVMEKLGMTHAPRDDFDHPELPDGHPLRRHVLYRLPNPLLR